MTQSSSILTKQLTIKSGSQVSDAVCTFGATFAVQLTDLSTARMEFLLLHSIIIPLIG